MGKPKTGFRGKKNNEQRQVLCPDCGEDLGTQSFDHYPWPSKSMVFHCTGGTGFGDTSRGETHHSAIRPLECWNCHERVGCAGCLPSPMIDSICAKCVVWVKKAGLLRHGPISNDPLSVAKRGGRPAPGLEQYPARWQIEYRQAGDLAPGVQYQDLIGMSPEQMAAYILAAKGAL